jgi:hypothetical protein
MTAGRIALTLALLGAWGGCNAQISDGGAGLTGVDAQPGHGGGDHGDGGTIDAARACAHRALFLNFAGQALTRAPTGTPSDASRNLASWMQIDQGTAPPYREGQADRASHIQTIVDGVRGQLAQFPITVVTTRPATGDYLMIVLGGTPGDVGSRFSAAVTTLDCGDAAPRDVAWIADAISPDQRVINLVLGATGFSLGLTGTLDPDDCMCGWANDCQSNNTTPCKLGAPIDRDPGADQRCPGAGATQNEVTAVHDAFCGT